MPCTLTDSRRLTGPNLLLDRPGAILDVALGGVPTDRVVQGWTQQVRPLLAAVGWERETLATRPFAGGVSLAFTAPPDALYAATEVNEAAWAATLAVLDGRPPDDAADVTARLQALIDAERNPAWQRLHAAARRHHVTLLSDEDHVSVGLGTGALTWPADALPNPDSVDWSAVHDVPVALVTGTNGKSTTVRLLARILQAAGRTPGLTSTDFIKVGDDLVERGDYSGPGGARTLLRDRRVDTALLEVARGGLLRRGLAVERATAALITNVAEDHLGEYGVETLGDLLAAKFVVHQAVADGGVLVLNADDAGLVRASAAATATRCWFSLAADNPVVQQHMAAGGQAAFVADGVLVYAAAGRRTPLLPVADLPIALGGAARYNVANSLGAVCLAMALGVEPAAIAKGLRTFQGDAADNPGRGNLFTVEGAQVLVDFAHNPHGLDALIDTVRRLPARRRLVMLGQAGDRSDDDIRNLARAAWQIHPDHVIILELPGYERGRAPGAVQRLLHDAFRQLGASEAHLAHAPSCLDGVQAALAWAAPGDLLLLLVLTQRDAVFRLLREAGTSA